VPDNPLPPERDEQFADILLFYKPDVVGIQEANRAWHDSFETLFDASGAYLPACKYHEGDSTAQTTFLYNPLTVTLIDEYVIHYSDGVNDIRIVSFAVFDRNSDGMRFVMTNTHPAPHAGNYEKHVDEFIRIKTEELAKYEGLPVIMTGDFNTRESQAQYTQIQTSLNVTDARYDEGVKLVRNICTYTSLPSGEAIHGSVYESSTGNIDHIFINDKLDALLFNVVIDHNVTNISDHLPIYADLKLK
jgi:endonuclease/exonuclease/phosphatase family metal-dependent hydrolase